MENTLRGYDNKLQHNYDVTNLKSKYSNWWLRKQQDKKVTTQNRVTYWKEFISNTPLLKDSKTGNHN